MYEYGGKVIRVIDGDTVDVDLDLGLDIHLFLRLRLYGINAAEHGTRSGDGATARLKELLPVGDPITVRTQKDKREKYGRYLATIFHDGDDQSVNQQMVDEGHAVPWDGTGKRPVPA